MKTFNKYSFTILFLFFFTGASYSFSLELSKGVLQEFGMSFTAEQRLALPKVTKTIDAVEPTGGAMSLAFVNVRETDEWYRLFDNMKLYGVNVKEEKLRGVWPLTPWPYRYASPAVIVQYGELALEYPSTSSDFEYRIYPGVGCYGNVPLRYGDVEGDGKSELVLFFGDFFIIFSPETGKTVFAEKLNESDWLNDKEMLEYYKISGDGTRPTAQYASLLHYENNSFSIGLRAYAKLYFGDFDKDGSPDILAWRKAYRSNPGTNPVKGFTKIEENLQHFKRSSTGEYLPQDTSPEIIQNWLSAKNLTWQKGFPSKSECAGEEGRLIPEMHDPLLNDPDVLK